ncbi:OmpW/AlkL family protein [Roseateles sp.]|uniref:OmpW/AlkL family protein n=1 Tax=Roseateles sp. TaxID=1971397 RepID=UPI003924E9FB
MSKFSTLAALATAVVALAAPCLASAQEGPWMVRARVLNLDSANKDSTGLGLSVNNKTFPEVDISYFLAPNVAAELILTYPQKHTIYSNGTAIGSLKHLPPTLTLQYHFNPTGAVRPYVGAGLNYTNFSSVSFSSAVAALQPSIKHNSFGLAAQVGADFEVSKGLYLNVDLKKVSLGTTVYSKGVEAGKFKVNPVLASVGLGWRF